MDFVFLWVVDSDNILSFSNIKATDGEAQADSDDEFAKELNPVTEDTPIDQGNIPLQDEESSSSEPSSPVPPVEAKLFQGLITSAISQGLSSITNRQDDQEMQGECNHNVVSKMQQEGGRGRLS